MNVENLKLLLQAVRDRAISIDSAIQELQLGPFKSAALAFAEPDHHRSLRHGLAEVIFGEGKTVNQIVEIMNSLNDGKAPVLVTRLDEEKLASVSCKFPAARVNHLARTLTLNAPEELSDFDIERRSFVAILSAGTVDVPVAEEAVEVCVATSTPFRRVYDVGVAGIHRLMNKGEIIEKAAVLVVVAGMEGTLPGIVAGMFGKAVFAVPTSVGYGTGLGGLSALLTMLNTCSPGVTVTNIDNGFGAGFSACQIIRAIKQGRAHEQSTVS